MATAIAQRTRSEEIGDVLTALEHLWKMRPTMTFAELLRDVLGDVDGKRDNQVEWALREELRRIMQGGRDRT